MTEDLVRNQTTSIVQIEKMDLDLIRKLWKYTKEKISKERFNIYTTSST